MNNEEAALPGGQSAEFAQPAEPVAPAQPTDLAGSEEPVAPAEPVTPAEPETPVETQTQVEVGLQRSVRYGRILVGGAIVGAVIAIVASLLFPVLPDADYELGQIAGFMALIGAAIGLFLGGVLSLILGVAAKRHRGAALAVLTDVR